LIRTASKARLIKELVTQISLIGDDPHEVSISDIARKLEVDREDIVLGVEKNLPSWITRKRDFLHLMFQRK